MEEPHKMQKMKEPVVERTLLQKCHSRIRTLLQTFQTAFEASSGWETVFAISCLFGVSVDPFFFYVPIIQEETKCLRMDNRLRTTVIVLRTITDLFLIVRIIIATRGTRCLRQPDSDKSTQEKKAGKVKLFFIMIDILAVLPIPQVLIGTKFKLGSSTYLKRIKTIHLFLVAQYLPRIYLMHHSSTNIRRAKGVWIPSAFYFSMYILAGHVFGAFWYFFSIQRETSCWHQICLKHRIECNFDCDEDTSSRNMTFVNFLDEFCLVDVPADATTRFDFGIFLDSLKNGITRKVNFQKYLYSFWWGLRNLSNFGTNLETSTYEWENWFAIVISIVGMLLFLYSIGNVQAFILKKNEIAEEKRKKLQSLELDTQIWMHRYGLPKEMKIEIWETIKQNFEKIKEADMEGLFFILPVKTRIALKRFLCMKILRKVPFPLTSTESHKEAVQEKVLTSIRGFLKPVIYLDNSFVFRMGEPLDRMLFITQGSAWTYNKEGTSATILEKGAYYGEELVSWASSGLDPLATVPMLQANLKCHTKIEGFVLMAKDLKVVVHKHKHSWGFSDYHVSQLVAVQTIQKAFRQFMLRWLREQEVVVVDDLADAAEAPFMRT